MRAWRESSRERLGLELASLSKKNETKVQKEQKLPSEDQTEKTNQLKPQTYRKTEAIESKIKFSLKQN